MGIGPKFSTGAEAKLGEPQAHRFRIESLREIGDTLIAFITYPDASEYAGLKLVMYRFVSEAELRSASKLDPHFLAKSSFPVPFARFEPSEAGLAAAIALAHALRN